ncbi:MAG: glycosyltransferase family 4 protein, partial [Phycisphaeraceae bacterium]
MNILQLTPGTGNFHCGTCLRDHAIVRAMRKRGHDVLMVPLYMPFVADDEGADEGTPIFYSGVSVYLEQKSWLFRKMPRWLSRLLSGPRLLRWAAGRSRSTRTPLVGDLTISMLQGEDGKQAAELEHLIGWLRTQPKPDVIVLSNALLIGMARRLKQAFNCPIVSFLQGEDLFLDDLPEPQKTKSWQAAAARANDVDAYIAVSAYYGSRMTQAMSLDPKRVHVVPVGISIDDLSPAKEPPSQPTIGYLARMSEGKGLHILIDAFIALKKADRVPGLRLKVTGARTREDEKYVKQQQAKLAKAGFAADAEWAYNVSRAEKVAMLQTVSVLSVPAPYPDSFGIYLLEAWASGVPVVQPRLGAFIELVESTGAGVLCEPNDPASLAAALEVLLLKSDEARSLGHRGRSAVEQRFSIERMAENVLKVFDRTRGLTVSGEAESARPTR